jgi:Transcriptional regulator PadR-like family
VHGCFDGLGRFAEPSLLLLTSLADGPKHGYAIMTDVAAFSGVRMEPGTLYGALARLERRGWVRPLGAAGRRRRYEIAAVWPCRAGRGGAAGRARLPAAHGS